MSDSLTDKERIQKAQDDAEAYIRKVLVQKRNILEKEMSKTGLSEKEALENIIARVRAKAKKKTEDAIKKVQKIDEVATDLERDIEVEKRLSQETTSTAKTSGENSTVAEDQSESVNEDENGENEEAEKQREAAAALKKKREEDARLLREKRAKEAEEAARKLAEDIAREKEEEKKKHLEAAFAYEKNAKEELQKRLEEMTDEERKQYDSEIARKEAMAREIADKQKALLSRPAAEKVEAEEVNTVRWLPGVPNAFRINDVFSKSTNLRNCSSHLPGVPGGANFGVSDKVIWLPGVPSSNIASQFGKYRGLF